MATLIYLFYMIFGGSLLHTPNSYRETHTEERAKVTTSLDKKELFNVLKEGHIDSFGKPPSNKRWAMGWAQISLENGHGERIYNNNLGMIGASEKQPHFYIGGSRFKANDTAEEGAAFYWKTVKKMCPSALNYFDHGDPKGAAAQLYRCGYYRADKNFYSKLMSQLYYQACKEIVCSK